MRKRAAIVMALVVGLIAIAAPILVALYVAGSQSLDEERVRAASLASEVLRRSDETSLQILAAFDKLEAARSADPCSLENIERMREIDVGSTNLQTVGYVANNKLMCSSLGSHGVGIAIGAPDYVNITGVSIRASVVLPFAPTMRFTISTREQSGYAAIVHRSLPLDVAMYRPDMAIGLVGQDGKPLMNRGAFKPEWLEGTRPGQKNRRFDGDYIVATEYSGLNAFTAYAAVPATYLRAGMRRTALLVVPVGIAAGLMLAFAVFYLTRQQLSLPALLRVALRADEFFLLYQPLVDLQSGSWHGAEALIRWRRKDGEVLAPDLFIHAAEGNGLIRQLTRKVMALVVRDIAELLQRNTDFHVGINLSPEDLQSNDIVNELHDMIKKAGIGPGGIMVEATERGFLNAKHVAQTIRDIRKMSICVAIDDFGTGYSSLSYLTTFELDYLKIDKSFVDTIGTESATSQVILHIIEMAKSLKLKIIAEGVETEAQAHYLREHGVHYAQGWLFGKPMSPAELASRLEAQRQQG
ncbi:EAL domain-containing protein [Janthinobacterium sp. 17J80-10]|uniref:EAL domain-containing protein n=1 Tax=Janthinobacterium sp. 17J80-10 TaxID=2497863 RepID=UPI0010052815|nr:EAL domain-containing protein [Janthinobacterium sp. 17J80-10]QAU32795.1 EAL domain-containing protein [Janthinobacterium sp. 17J80-10]